MAPRYMSEREKHLLTLTAELIFVISTASTSKEMEKDSYAIENAIKNGIKLCAECVEHGQCAIIEHNIETLTCHLLRNESKIERKEGRATHERSHSHVAAISCMCNFGQRCLKTRSGIEDCVQASTDSKPITVPPALVTTHDYDPHATPSRADRRLFSASEIGDLERVKQILATGHVNINTRGRWRRTPVMEASWRGHKDVVELLVGRGADVSLVADYGYNTLHLACLGKGDLETVKLILSLNVVDINAKNFNRMTAVAIARRKRRQRLVDLLVSYGAH